MYFTTENETVYSQDGKVLYFGFKDFISKIVEGDCCFICGADRLEKAFNNEHVIPDWILRKYNLHAERITLANNSELKYGSYVVPCCVECNSEMSRVYEIPISKMFSRPYSEIGNILTQDNSFDLIFKWLCLIFIKTHLKDTLLLKNIDRRITEGYIGDDFFWGDMHHIHCIARSHYTQAKISDNVYGTVFIFPSILKGEDSRVHYDYIDNEKGKGLLIQLGELTVIAILNDSCAGYNLYKERFEKITD